MYNIPNNRILYLFGFLLSCALIGVALFMQYGLGYDPCPLCIFQRIAFIIVGLVCLIAAIHNPLLGGNKVYAGLISLGGLFGLGIALRQSWIQHFPPKFVECGAGLEYWLETLPIGKIIQNILSGTGDCTEVVWTFLGLSIPEWAAVLFTIYIIFAIYLWRRPRDRY